MSRRTLAARALWLLPIAPALAQLGLLFYAVLSRVGYPYDLEWMEGGLLGHAARLSEHQGIYVEPSLDFIPYLYTPLYPALIALLSSLFGISYTVGRIISLLSLVALLGFAVAAVARERSTHRAAARASRAITSRLVRWPGGARASSSATRGRSRYRPARGPGAISCGRVFTAATSAARHRAARSRWSTTASWSVL